MHCAVRFSNTIRLSLPHYVTFVFLTALVPIGPLTRLPCVVFVCVRVCVGGWRTRELQGAPIIYHHVPSISCFSHSWLSEVWHKTKKAKSNCLITPNRPLVSSKRSALCGTNRRETNLNNRPAILIKSVLSKAGNKSTKEPWWTRRFHSTPVLSSTCLSFQATWLKPQELVYTLL